MIRTIGLVAVLLLSAGAAGDAQASPAANESLFEAARAGDTARIAAALNRGANVNAKSRYEVTALILAAGNGRLDAAKLLVAARRRQRAGHVLSHARGRHGHRQRSRRRGRLLLQNGSEGGSTVLLSPCAANNTSLLKAVLGTKLTRQDLQSAVAMAERLKRDALMPLLKTALDALPAEPAATAFSVNSTDTPRYAGTYRDSAGGLIITMTVQDGALMAQPQGQPAIRLMPTADRVFRVVEVDATLTFNERGGLMESVQLVQGPATLVLARVTAGAPPPSRAPLRPSVRRRPSPLRTGPRQAAQLAVISRRRRRRERRRAAGRDGMGYREREEHQVEDADAGHCELEPNRVGQPGVRDDRHQQGR